MGSYSVVVENDQNPAPLSGPGSLGFDQIELATRLGKILGPSHQTILFALREAGLQLIARSKS